MFFVFVLIRLRLLLTLYGLPPIPFYRLADVWVESIIASDYVQFLEGIRMHLGSSDEINSLEVSFLTLFSKVLVLVLCR